MRYKEAAMMLVLAALITGPVCSAPGREEAEAVRAYNCDNLYHQTIENKTPLEAGSTL